MPSWQTKFDNLAQRSAYMLEHEIFTDCSFIVGQGNDIKKFLLHRADLARTSPVFEAMFFGGLAKNQQFDIHLPDIQPSAFKTMVKYIYCGEVTLTDVMETCGVLYAAKKYLLPASFIQQCRAFIWANMYPNHIWAVLDFAESNDEKELADTTWQLIQEDTVTLLKQDDFLSVSRDILLRLVKERHLSCSELALYDACVRWCLVDHPATSRNFITNFFVRCYERVRIFFADMRVTQVGTPHVNVERGDLITADCETDSSLRESMQPFLKHIRLLSLSLQELAETVKSGNVITQDEFMSIFLRISYPDEPNKYPIPTGFCQILDERTVHYFSSFQVIGHSSFPLPEANWKWNTLGYTSRYRIASFKYIAHNKYKVPTQLKPKNSKSDEYDEDIELICFDVNTTEIFDKCRETRRVPYGSSIELKVKVPSCHVSQDSNNVRVRVIFYKSGVYPTRHGHKW